MTDLLRQPLIAALASTPAGEALLRGAGALDIRFDAKMLDLQGCEAMAQLTDGILLLDERASLPRLEHLLAHELRHFVQYRAGTSNRFTLEPWDMIKASRLEEADADGWACQYAFERREAGAPAVWEAFRAHRPDMAAAYLLELRDDPAAYADGRARKAAFAAFYESVWARNYEAWQLRRISALRLNLAKEHLVERMSANEWADKIDARPSGLDLDSGRPAALAAETIEALKRLELYRTEAPRPWTLPDPPPAAPETPAPKPHP